MKDLISIIVPVYNTEKYLNRCVDSLIKQSYENTEILLINDGSTDGSEKICAEYEKNNENVFLFTKPNGGLSDARNYGLEKAKGTYVMFVDSDDFISENMAEMLYGDIKYHGADISCVDMFKFGDECSVFPKTYNPEKTIVSDGKSAVKTLLGGKEIYNYAWNKIYKKQLFETVKFPKGYLMEDLGTAYLLIEKACKITYNPAQLYYYYQRGDSILHSPNPKFYKDKYELAKKRFIYIKEKYPDYIENDKSMLSVLIECFSYVYMNGECKNISHILGMIDKKVGKLMNWKFKIKYLIFKCKFVICTITERTRDV